MKRSKTGGMIYFEVLSKIRYGSKHIQKNERKMKPARKFLSCFSTIIFLSLTTTTILHAELATGCHCFNDRAYDPSDKFAADGYLLATSFNSLLSEHFGISKRQIIQYKMQGGTSQDDILIGLTISKDSGGNLKHLLDLRKKKSWAQILEGLMLSGYTPSPVLIGLKEGTAAYQATSEIADKLISQFFRTSQKKVENFRAKGFTEKEITLLLLLASISNIPAETIASQHNKKRKSWSEIAHSYGVEPAATGKLISNYAKK